LVAGVLAAAKNAGVAMTANRVGSMFTWFFAPARCTIGIRPQNPIPQLFGKFFRGMLDHGVYLPPAQYEAAFLSAAHSEADVEATIAAAKLALG